jgi:outer membrane receptor protein involved in Fe transport
MKISKVYLCLVAVGTTVSLHATEVDSSADTTVYVTNLHDVEVVGVKQKADNPLELSTVIRGVDAERYKVASIKSISEATPNFFIPAYGSRMTSSIYVRGLGARIEQPVVGLNVDNVPILNKDNYDFDFIDIDRMEVLRGSRSVLHGRNSMGGQINIYTLSPWQYEGVRAKVEYSRANTLKASAGWYGKLSEKLASSVTAMYGTTDGFYKNEYDNSDCAREREASARWKMSWHPDSRWSLLNAAAVTYSRQTGYPYESLANGKIAYNDSVYYRRTSFTDGLTVSYTGRKMIATSITSVQYLNDDMTLDQDFLPEDYFTLAQRRKEWAVTEDLFAKGFKKNYDWLIGVFGFYKSTDMNAPVTFKDTGISRLIEDNVNGVLPAGMKLQWDERLLTLGSLFDKKDGGFALYHQSTVRFGDFTVQGGLRWDIESVSLDYTSRCFSSCTMYRGQYPLGQREVNIDQSGHLSQTFNQLLPQLAIDWAPSKSWNLRASVAKGYKAGGYNTQMFSDVLQQQIMEQMGVQASYDVEEMMTYKPEKSWTYELSSAAQTKDGRLNAELVLFYMNCRDQQLTIFPHGTTTGRAMTNAGRTRSYGAEFTATWRPVDAFTLRASYGYTHATFTKYNNGIEDLKGKYLPYAPQHTIYAAANYVLPVTFAGITPSINVNTRAAGRIYWTEDNSEYQNLYATLGASIMFEHKYGSVTLWGENLTDTRYSTFYFESIGNRFVQRANPYTIGATLRLNL